MCVSPPPSRTRLGGGEPGPPPASQPQGSRGQRQTPAFKTLVVLAPGSLRRQAGVYVGPTRGAGAGARLASRLFREWGFLGWSGLRRAAGGGGGEKSDAEAGGAAGRPSPPCGASAGRPPAAPWGWSRSSRSLPSPAPIPGCQRIAPAAPRATTIFPNLRRPPPARCSRRTRPPPPGGAEHPLLAGSPRLTQEVRQDDRNNPPALQRPGFRSMYLYGLQNAVGA